MVSSSDSMVVMTWCISGGSLTPAGKVVTDIDDASCRGNINSFNSLKVVVLNANVYCKLQKSLYN